MLTESGENYFTIVNTNQTTVSKVLISVKVQVERDKRRNEVKERL